MLVRSKSTLAGSTRMAWPPPLPAAPPDTLARACAGDQHRQFDFWLGRWSVAVPGQAPSAVNEISRQAGGCFLREQYHTAAGYTGSSINWYSPSDGLWRQIWIDNSGLVLRLEGELRGSDMVLSGHRRTPDGRLIWDRITWVPSPDGTVRQIWDVSTDEGHSWRNDFTGIYTRIE